MKSPAVQIESTPNGSFSRPRILTTDPDLPVEYFQSGRSQQQPTGRKLPFVTPRGRLSGGFEVGSVSERRLAPVGHRQPATCAVRFGDEPVTRVTVST